MRPGLRTLGIEWAKCYRVWNPCSELPNFFVVRSSQTLIGPWTLENFPNHIDVRVYVLIVIG